jgi:hypothetical protein
MATPSIPASPNPWDDAPAASTKDFTIDKETPKPFAAFDPSIYEQPIFTGLKGEGLKGEALKTPEPRIEVAKDVLTEFDPLVSLEEKAARDAWETSESHPPPPRTPSPPPLPPSKELHTPSPTTPGPTSDPAVTSSAASPSPFPSFAAFARSFALPLRTRPQSLDGSANAVPSPSTLSSFASQQEISRSERLDNGKAVASGTSTPINQTGSGAASPVPKPNDGGFDFQKFLDQMKTKSADPVSKYLRSYVFLILRLILLLDLDI